MFHAWSDPADAAAVAAAFVAGARYSDACVLFSDELGAARLRHNLLRCAAPGRPPRDFIHIGPDEVFVDAGPSPIGSLIALRNRLAGETLATGRQVRLIIMSDAGAANADLRDRAEAFESMFTGHGQPPVSILALCLYDARRHSADMIELASSAHPWTMRDGRIVQNPLYMNPVPAVGSRVA